MMPPLFVIPSEAIDLAQCRTIPKNRIMFDETAAVQTRLSVLLDLRHIERSLTVSAVQDDKPKQMPLSS
jgi:hypothetical protein